MKTEFTPGPWNFTIEDGRPHVYDSIGSSICEVSRKVTEVTGPEMLNRTLPNAQLIAAAPELLDALQFILKIEGDERGFKNSVVYLTAREAIKKATL